MLPILKNPPFPCQRRGGIFSIIDKFIHKHYNIYKYNTKGKRRSAHYPKGGVAYDEITGYSFRAFARGKIGDYHHKEKITALLQPERFFLLEN